MICRQVLSSAVFTRTSFVDRHHMIMIGTRNSRGPTVGMCVTAADDRMTGRQIRQCIKISRTMLFVFVVLKGCRAGYFNRMIMRTEIKLATERRCGKGMGMRSALIADRIRMSMIGVDRVI